MTKGRKGVRCCPAPATTKSSQGAAQSRLSPWSMAAGLLAVTGVGCSSAKSGTTERSPSGAGPAADLSAEAGAVDAGRFVSHGSPDAGPSVHLGAEAGAQDAAQLANDGSPDAGGAVHLRAQAWTTDAGCVGSCRLRPAVEARIDQVLAVMTLAEKVEEKAGGPTTPVNGLYPTPPIPRLGIPGFKMVDGSRGVSIGTGNATAFPVASLRGATWDPALEERVGGAIGLECAAKGANVLLAPVINLLRHPRWGRSQETYGEDTYHLGRMGVGFVKGVQKHVLANAKHYAANSIENSRFFVNVVMDERTLREVYLPHFQAVVEEANVASIMSSYNKVNGFHSGENRHLLSDILKGDWQFEGFVESDWLAGTTSTAPSALAGLDIEMPLANFFGQPLITAVEADGGIDGGAVPMSVIDESVRRILRRMFEYQLDAPAPQPPASAVESPEHEALALEVAQKGIVLLKNDGGALPLDRSKLRSLAVVGSLSNVANLGDHGSSDVGPTITVTPLAGIQKAAGSVVVTSIPSDTLTTSEQFGISAVDAAVVVVGLTANDEGEGFVTTGDRTSLQLSATHIALIQAVSAVNPRTIVVVEGGSAITVEGWIDRVKGLIDAWYPGVQGGVALADILFGDVNPSGKLPVTVPTSEAQLPPFDNTSSEVTYGFLHGYRYVDHSGTSPRFPFGFGLSYTRFSYANLSLAAPTTAPGGNLTVSVDVTNTGTVAGDEIAQLYVSVQGSAVELAVRDLKGFQRVHLDPGQRETVSFALTAQDLAYYDVGRAAWVLEPTAYVISVGASSRDLPLSATVYVDP
jgi:beta-glucosidase